MAGELQRGSFNRIAPSGAFLNKSGGSYTEAPSISHNLKARELSLGERKESNAASYNKSFARQTTLGWAVFLKPVIIGALIVVFVVGPGAIALSALLTAMPWYLWLVAIFLLLLVVRRR